jgi:hypothetical protein
MAASALIKVHAEDEISLCDFLTALYFNAQPDRDKSSISLERFIDLLRMSFQPVPQEAPAAPPFDRTKVGYAQWSDTILRQIRDLKEMDRKGMLGKVLNFLGLSAPSGAYWYNFDPCGYIECGMAGAFGGWREGDDTGRIYVPGEVAVSDDRGKISFHDPRSLADDQYAMTSMSWDEFREFLMCGQAYE